jgi:hypothetical protein
VANGVFRVGASTMLVAVNRFFKMEQNSNGGMKHQEGQEKREQRISKVIYLKTKVKNYYVVRFHS